MNNHDLTVALVRGRIGGIPYAELAQRHQITDDECRRHVRAGLDAAGYPGIDEQRALDDLRSAALDAHAHDTVARRE